MSRGKARRSLELIGACIAIVKAVRGWRELAAVPGSAS